MLGSNYEYSVNPVFGGKSNFGFQAQPQSIYAPGAMLSGVMNGFNTKYGSAGIFGGTRPANNSTLDSQMFDSPSFDPNAGYQEARNKAYNDYMMSLVNSGKKRINMKRANKDFEEYFDADWKAGEQGRMNSFYEQQAEARAQQMAALRQQMLDDQVDTQDELSRLYEQEGYAYDGATGKWVKNQTDGLNFDDVEAVQQWLVDRGINLGNYGVNKNGVDGKYGKDTRAAIEGLLAQENSGLTNMDREALFKFQQNNANNMVAHKQPTSAQTRQTSTQPATKPATQTSQVNPFAFKGSDNYTNKAALLSDLDKQYNDYVGGKYSVVTPAGVTLVGRSIRDDSGYKQALDATMRNYQENGWLTPSYTIKSKRGGTLIKRHQQGGNVEQDIQAQVKQLVQAVANGDQQAAEQVKQIMQAAEQGDQQALQIAQMIQAEIEAIKSAKRGAKLNYIKSLKGDCPDGEEVVYFKKGGEICKACQKKHSNMVAEKDKNLNVIEEFKKGRKTKKC